MKYELQVIGGHRYAEVSIRLADGSKAWVNKSKVTTLQAKELAEGEESAIARYEAEGRLQVVRVQPKRRRRRKPKQVEKELESADLESADLEE